MDITTIITAFALVLANIGTVVGLFLWSTSNSNEFRKEAAAATEEHRKETASILKSIADEMKDFHGRLCSIEERHRK